MDGLIRASCAEGIRSGRKSRRRSRKRLHTRSWSARIRCSRSGLARNCATRWRCSEERGKDKFPVIPLSLNGTKLGVLEEFFGEEPIYIPVSSDAGGVEAAINALLVALEQRLPADVPAAAQPKAEPLEELVLELTDLKFHEQDGVRRASARARLVYEPATPGQPDVHSVQSWRLIAPIGPIEAEELRWYLEKYAIWPSHYFRDRARKVEENLVKWGQLLYEAAMPVVHSNERHERLGQDR